MLGDRGTLCPPQISCSTGARPVVAVAPLSGQGLARPCPERVRAGFGRCVESAHRRIDAPGLPTLRCVFNVNVNESVGRFVPNRRGAPIRRWADSAHLLRQAPAAAGEGNGGGRPVAGEHRSPPREVGGGGLNSERPMTPFWTGSSLTPSGKGLLPPPASRRWSN